MPTGHIMGTSYGVHRKGRREERVKEERTGDKLGQIVEYKENQGQNMREANTFLSNTAATPAKPLPVVPPCQNRITICGKLLMIE